MSPITHSSFIPKPSAIISAPSQELQAAKERKMVGTATVFRGASFLFLNTFLLYVIRFFYRLITSRSLGPYDYGLFSFGLMILGVFSLLGTLGLNNGIIRYISHYQGRNDILRLRGTVLASFFYTLLASTLFATLIILFSSQISEYLFHDLAFAPILVIFALCIPLYSVYKLFGKSFIGFKRPELQIFSTTIARDLVLFLLVGAALFFGFGLLEISLLYIVTFVISILVSWYLFSKHFFSFFELFRLWKKRMKERKIIG